MSLSFLNLSLASEFTIKPISKAENFGKFSAARVRENKISEFLEFPRASEFRIIEICVDEKNSACFKIFPDSFETSAVFWQSLVISSHTRFSIKWGKLKPGNFYIPKYSSLENFFERDSSDPAKATAPL